MTERDQLLASVCEKPSEAVPKLVFADWLDEHGECGESMRWTVRSGKWPQAVAGFQWRWRLFEPMLDHEFLPILFRDYMPINWAGSPQDRHYPSQDAAWSAFIVAFGVSDSEGKIGRKRRGSSPSTV